jgi:hypothetical protein
LLGDIPDYAQRTAADASRPEPVLQSRLLNLAWRYVRHHPAYPLKVAFYNGVRLLDLGGLQRSRFTAGAAGITSSSVATVVVICFWIVGLLAAIGLALARVRRAMPAFIWVAAALVLMSVLFVNTETPRFRIPLDPFLVLLAAGTLSVAGERLAGARERRTGFALGEEDPVTAGSGSILRG